MAEGAADGGQTVEAMQKQIQSVAAMRQSDRAAGFTDELHSWTIPF
jgi:hypothetical protein